MAENTGISWADHTFNPWWGCAKVSPACRFCYANTTDKRWGGQHWGRKASRKMMSESYWRQPEKWNRKAAAEGRTLRVFAASMADVFEDHPDVVDARNRLFNLIEQTPALTWMLLTKRPENVAGMVPWGGSWPGSVWLGVSAETQKFADQRIPILLDQPAAVRFVSAAPLLGPVDLTRWLLPRPAWGTPYPEPTSQTGVPVSDLVSRPGLNWVITEGESGSKARPSHPAWFRSLRDQCEAAGVVFHHKQNGEWHHQAPPEWAAGDAWLNPQRHCWVDPVTGKTKPFGEFTGTDDAKWAHVMRVGLNQAGRLLDGRLHDGHPGERVAVTA